LRTWNVNLRIAYNEFEKIVNVYQDIMRSNLTTANIQKIKFLILEKAQSVRAGENKIYIDMLTVLGFDARYVENLGPETYAFKFSDEIFKLSFTGYLVNGVKEGRGEFRFENGDMFYSGAFKNGEIYGVNIKLWYNCFTMFAHLKHVHDIEDNDFFDSITLMGNSCEKFNGLYLNKFVGTTEIYHRNKK